MKYEYDTTGQEQHIPAIGAEDLLGRLSVSSTAADILVPREDISPEREDQIEDTISELLAQTAEVFGDTPRRIPTPKEFKAANIDMNMMLDRHDAMRVRGMEPMLVLAPAFQELNMGTLYQHFRRVLPNMDFEGIGKLTIKTEDMTNAEEARIIGALGPDGRLSTSWILSLIATSYSPTLRNHNFIGQNYLDSWEEFAQHQQDIIGHGDINYEHYHPFLTTYLTAQATLRQQDKDLMDPETMSFVRDAVYTEHKELKVGWAIIALTDALALGFKLTKSDQVGIRMTVGPGQ